LREQRLAAGPLAPGDTVVVVHVVAAESLGDLTVEAVDAPITVPILAPVLTPRARAHFVAGQHAIAIPIFIAERPVGTPPLVARHDTIAIGIHCLITHLSLSGRRA
jgi:hypothetical protein